LAPTCAPAAEEFIVEAAAEAAKVPMEKDMTEEQATNEAILEPEIVPDAATSMVKFEIFGEEMLEKRVKLSGNSGRIYLPPDWVGHRVKVIRID